MSHNCLAGKPALVLAALIGVACHAGVASAQQQGSQPIHFRVSGASQKLEMIVNTSRILTLDYDVPRILVQNPEIVQATPLSPRQIQISARRAGVTAINVWDDQNQVHAIDLRVYADARELQDMLTRVFPDATIEVRPLNSRLLLTGYVPRPDMVNDVVEMARDYYPEVINRLNTGGAQTIALHVKVVEVSRTKLRQLGVDWAVITGGDFVIQSAGGLINAAATQGGRLTGAQAGTVRFGVASGNTQIGSIIDTLRQNNMAKVLAEPTLVTTSGRPARFNSGGDIPIPISGGLGVTSVQFREFGTTVDFVPIVLGNGNIRLEVRPEVTEVDPSLRDSVTGTPGFRTRRVDTGVEMRAGQTLILAGLIQNRVEAENKGIPWLADLPWAGAAFRRVQEKVNEVELLITVTPQFVGALDPHEVPPGGPGQATTSPSDLDLYWRGYLEVPRCCTDGSCPQCRLRAEQGGLIGPFGTEPYRGEVLPASPSVRLPQPDQYENAGPRLNESSSRGTPRGGNVEARYSAARFTPTPASRPSESAATPSDPPYDYYQRNNPSPTAAQYRVGDGGSEPNLIGPLGYDVIK